MVRACPGGVLPRRLTFSHYPAWPVRELHPIARSRVDDARLTLRPDVQCHRRSAHAPGCQLRCQATSVAVSTRHASEAARGHSQPPSPRRQPVDATLSCPGTLAHGYLMPCFIDRAATACVPSPDCSWLG